MKKKLVVWTLMLGIILAGCGTKASQTADYPEIFNSMDFLPEYDAVNKYLPPMGASFWELDDMYIGTNTHGEFLHYYDKNTKTAGLFCMDPSCTHDSVDCAAFIDYGPRLSIYNGKRYYVANYNPGGVGDDYLWRSDLDGTNREKVKKIDFDDILMLYQPQYYVVHRGYLYFVGRSNSVTGANGGIRHTVLCSPLDDSEEFKILADTTDTDISCVRFVGPYVYIQESKFSESDYLKITRIDTRTWEPETIYSETGIGQSFYHMWVTQDGEIYVPSCDNTAAYVWKVENGERKKVISWEDESPSYPRLFDGIAVYNYWKDETMYCDIVDLDGNSIYSGNMFPQEIPGMEGVFHNRENYYTPIGGDADKILVVIDAFDVIDSLGRTASYYMILDLHDNLKPTLLWN